MLRQTLLAAALSTALSTAAAQPGVLANYSLAQPVMTMRAESVPP